MIDEYVEYRDENSMMSKKMNVCEEMNVRTRTDKESLTVDSDRMKFE